MSSSKIFENLFIFEMANNHMGDLEHGKRIIREFHEVSKDFPQFKFAFKFQYRDLETFIHPKFKNSSEFKYIKRFTETNLTSEQRKTLMEEAKRFGFLTICTAFDEKSVDLVEEHGYDIIKIASCSFTDWPLLERVIKTDMPIIASTAGVSLDDIDKVILFFENRNKKFCILHCVAEYPTKKENLQLNQIDLLKSRYPHIPIGYSTHESPDNFDSIKIAIGKGARVFEKHVAVPTEKYSINAYSATPEQVRKWLEAANEALLICGIEGRRYEGTEKEKQDLRGLQRGVFARRDIREGERIDSSNTFFAIPNFEGQLIANQLSKYHEYKALRDIPALEPILERDLSFRNLRDRVFEIVTKIKELMLKSRVPLPNRLDMEISHHYGIDRFEEWGAAIINCINREYCKKLIILLPGQKHPVHYHLKKEEAFHILFGDMKMTLNDEERYYSAGDIVVVERGVKHSFSSKGGVIFEEISTTHYPDDSFYEDELIKQNQNRKTPIILWTDWLLKRT